MRARRPTPTRLAGALAQEAVGRWGYAPAKGGICVREDTFRREVYIEYDKWQLQFKDRELLQVFLAVEDARCPDFTKEFGPVGLWLDVYAAIHHEELADDERGGYEPAPGRLIPPQLIDDLKRNGETLLNYPSTVADMVELLTCEDRRPVHGGLWMGQFTGGFEARLLKALILARWSEDSNLTDRVMAKLAESAEIPGCRRPLRMWIRNYSKYDCVDVSGVLDS
jgi:hypothetical protein